jgi:hypothetical protein
MFSWLWGASESSAAAPATAAGDAVAQLQSTLADASHTFRPGAMGLKTYTLPAFAGFPPEHSPLSLMCLADCHSRFPEIACMPPCDVLVVAGDFTLTGSEAEARPPLAAPLARATHPPQVLQFYAWATACQWRYCVLVPGFCELRAGLTPERLQVPLLDLGRTTVIP